MFVLPRFLPLPSLSNDGIGSPPPVSCPVGDGPGGAVSRLGLREARRFLGFEGGGKGGGIVFSIVLGAMGGGSGADSTSSSGLEAAIDGDEGFCFFCGGDDDILTGPGWIM